MENEYLYIILVSNSAHQVSAYGTESRGKPFRSYEAAESRMKVLQRYKPQLDYLVLEINPSEVPVWQ